MAANSNKKPRILFIIGSLTRGGAETQLTRLVTAMKAHNWQVAVISILPETGYAEELRRASVPVFSLSSEHPSFSNIFSIVRSFYNHLRHLSPDILVSFLIHADILARIVGKIAKVPVIINSIRNESFAGSHGQKSVKNLVREMMYRSTNFLSDKIVLNSKNAEKVLTEKKVIDRNKNELIYNGIECSEYEFTKQQVVSLRSELGLTDNSFAWFTAGRLEEQKDYPLMLDAFAIHQREYPNNYLFIAGDGSLKDQILEKINQLNLSDNVRLLGLRKDIPLLLNAMDALILSSKWEGLPNIVIEASTAGLPVVATDVGGVREIIEPGTNGLIVSQGNEEMLAGAMDTIVTMSSDKRRVWGEAGKSLVKDRFELNSIVDQWCSLFEELHAQ